MAQTDQLGAPDKNDFVDARYTLNRIWVHDVTVGTETANDVYNVQDFSADAPSFDVEEEVFQQGGGDESVTEQKGYNYMCRFSVQGGEWGTIMAQILDITWTSAGTAAIPNRFSPYPVITFERICRRKDNETLLFTDVYQDLIIRPTSRSGAMGTNNLLEIEGKSNHDMARLCSGTELAYEQFDGDGSTTEFTLAASALTLVDVTAQAREDWELDDAFFVKVKLSTDLTGTRQASGVSISNKTVTFTTAPANGAAIQILYAKAAS